MPLPIQVFFFEELGSNLFNASLTIVMLSVLIRNAVLAIPASHFKVRMRVSLLSQILEFLSSGQLLLKLVLMCFLVVGLGLCLGFCCLF